MFNLEKKLSSKPNAHSNYTAVKNCFIFPLFSTPLILIGFWPWPLQQRSKHKCLSALSMLHLQLTHSNLWGVVCFMWRLHLMSVKSFYLLVSFFLLQIFNVTISWHCFNSSWKNFYAFDVLAFQHSLSFLWYTCHFLEEVSKKGHVTRVWFCNQTLYVCVCVSVYVVVFP